MRIIVVGTTGSGKTTLARRIAGRLDIPCIELDALNWGPDWTARAPDVFHDLVAAAVQQPQWVIDGNYGRATRELVWPLADTVVWLDYSFTRTMSQLMRRTFRRLITQEPLWSDNRESWRMAFFSRESILLWGLTTFRRRRVEYARYFPDAQWAHVDRVRLRHPRETAQWLAGLRSPVDTTRTAHDGVSG